MNIDKYLKKNWDGKFVLFIIGSYGVEMMDEIDRAYDTWHYDTSTSKKWREVLRSTMGAERHQVWLTYHKLIGEK